MNIIVPGKHDKTYHQLVAEYSKKSTQEVTELYDRFSTVRDQANKRCRAALDVLSFRAKDNNEKPPAQVIRPVPGKAFPRSRQ